MVDGLVVGDDRERVLGAEVLGFDAQCLDPKPKVCGLRIGDAQLPQLVG